MSESVDVGDCVADGSYRLYASLRHALIFERAAITGGEPVTRELAWVVADGVAGPVNVVVRDAAVPRADQLHVSPQEVVLGGRVFRVSRRYSSSLRVGPLDATRLESHLRTFARMLADYAPAASLARLPVEDDGGGGFEGELTRRLCAGVSRLRAGDLAGGAAVLLGLGRGLTPSGDDFLAGLLLGLWALQQAGAADFTAERACIAHHVCRTNAFSRVLLDTAAGGRCLEPVKLLIEAIFDGRGEDIADLTRGLVAIGATSGADLGAGLAFTLAQYTRRGWQPC